MIYRQPTLSRNIGSQINRKAEGVVKLEDYIARNFLAIKFGNRNLENVHALVQRFGKTLFFFLEHFFDMCLCLHELGICITHFPGQRRDKFVEEQIVRAQLLAMANCATNNAPQHIAPALVARQHTVGDQK